MSLKCFSFLGFARARNIPICKKGNYGTSNTKADNDAVFEILTVAITDTVYYEQVLLSF